MKYREIVIKYNEKAIFSHVKKRLAFYISHVKIYFFFWISSLITTSESQSPIFLLLVNVSILCEYVLLFFITKTCPCNKQRFLKFKKK